MEAYKGWVRRNRHWMGSLESLANSLTWFLPDRFAESELAPEALSTLIGVLSAINDHIVATAPPEPQSPHPPHGGGAHHPPGVPRLPGLPGPALGAAHGSAGEGSPASPAGAGGGRECSVEGAVLALALMKEVEVLGEMAAEHLFGGRDNKWGAVALIEAVKAALRLVLLRHGGQWHMLQDGRTCLHQDQEEGDPTDTVRDPHAGPGTAERPLPHGFPPPPMGTMGPGPGHYPPYARPSAPLPIHPHPAPHLLEHLPPPMDGPPPWAAAAAAQGGSWPGHLGPSGSAAPLEGSNGYAPGSWPGGSHPPLTGASPFASDLRATRGAQPSSAGSLFGVPDEGEVAGAGAHDNGNRALQAFLRFQGKLRPSPAPMSRSPPEMQPGWRDSQGGPPAASPEWTRLAQGQQPALDGGGRGGPGPLVQYPAGGGPWHPQYPTGFPPVAGPAGYYHGQSWTRKGAAGSQAHAHYAGAVQSQQWQAHVNGGADSHTQSKAGREAGAGGRGERDGQEEAERTQAVRSQALFVLGEVLHVLRPVAYVLALRRWGCSSWKPWLLSLGLDVSSLALLQVWQLQQQVQRMERRVQQRRGQVQQRRGQVQQRPQLGGAAERGAKEEDGEKGKEMDAELRRRRWLLLLYLLRSPCFDAVTRPPLESVNAGLQRVPLVGSLAARAWDMLLGIQGLYFYTAAS